MNSADPEQMPPRKCMNDFGDQYMRSMYSVGVRISEEESHPDKSTQNGKLHLNKFF